MLTDPIKAKIDQPRENINIPVGDGGPVDANVGDNITALLNSTVRIICQASGVPRPQVTWKKDGKTFPLQKSILIDEDGNLLLPSVKIEDKGRYTCIVENEFGKDTSSSNVDVVCKFLTVYNRICKDGKPV